MQPIHHHMQIQDTVLFLQQAWNISAFKNYKDNDKGFVKVISSLYICVLMICGSWIIGIFPFVVDFLLHGEFAEGFSLIPVLTISVYYSAKSGFLGSYYTAKGESRHLFISTMVGSVFNVLGNFCLIPLLGLIGAALATGVSNFIVYFVRLIKIKNLDFEYYHGVRGWVEILFIFQCVIFSMGFWNYRIVNLTYTFALTLILVYANRNQIVFMFKMLLSRGLKAQ